MTKLLGRRAIARTFVILFALATVAGAQTYSVLTTFDGTNGIYPTATPLIDSSGNVFGTTEMGGGENCGVVYELVNDGGGSYTNKALHNFTCSHDGRDPYGGVVMDSAGNLYGTTFNYGPEGVGLVYELVNEGGGSYTFQVIHDFSSTGKGGRNPMGDLVMLKGSLYGVTPLGGGASCGTVYRLNKSDSKWALTVVHDFSNQGGACGPHAGVTFDKDGNIYGTTLGGGTYSEGTVYKLSPSGGGSYKETVLHSFEDSGTGGCGIYSGISLDSAGNLYGAAALCGLYDGGTIYQLKRSSNYGFSVLLTLDGTNGSEAFNQPGRLAIDSADNIYATAEYGGNGCGGTLFKLAAGSFLYTRLYGFDILADGCQPRGAVTFDSLGNLYGTTIGGGIQLGYGTVWKIANP